MLPKLVSSLFKLKNLYSMGKNTNKNLVGQQILTQVLA